MNFWKKFWCIWHWVLMFLLYLQTCVYFLRHNIFFRKKWFICISEIRLRIILNLPWWQSILLSKNSKINHQTFEPCHWNIYVNSKANFQPQKHTSWKCWMTQITMYSQLLFMVVWKCNRNSLISSRNSIYMMFIIRC